jgi:hypothetical protein
VPVFPKPPSLAGGSRLRSAAGVRSHTRNRWPKPPEETGPARAGASTSGATLTAPDERGAAIPPPLPRRTTAADWLPPPAFLPPGWTPAAPSGWTYWDSSQGTAPRPRTLPGASRVSWDAQATVDDLVAALDAERVYSTVDELAQAMYTQLATVGQSGRAPLGSYRGYSTVLRSIRVCEGSFRRPRACAA